MPRPTHLNISNRFTYITFATLTDTLKKIFSLVQRFILDPKQIFNFLRQAFNSDIKCIVGKLIKLFNRCLDEISFFKQSGISTRITFFFSSKSQGGMIKSLSPFSLTGLNSRIILLTTRLGYLLIQTYF